MVRVRVRKGGREEGRTEGRKGVVKQVNDSSRKVGRLEQKSSVYSTNDKA